MKKLFVITVLVILLLSSPVMAQELAKPWLLPDNSFYPLQRAIERIQLMLTFDSESRAKLHLQFAERRLAELNETIARAKFQYVEKIRADYESEMNETEKEINRTVALGRNATALAEHVSNVTYKHVLVLERVLEKVPDQAKPAIERAMNVSIKGHEIAVARILTKINRTAEEVRRFNCTIDADCRHLLCPQVLGSDTPICEDGKCKCGGRWQIVNKTEWRERFGEELTNETQRMQERIKERVREEVATHQRVAIRR
jgi:bisphosphoglycerate-dependent phosphoglycerate mutase